jgi:Bacterial Alpha-2-macroglobulin MG10 domain/Alpha-2-macroglobulin family/MG2 domain
MFLRSLLLTSVILLSYLVFFGQSAFPYEQEWKLVDSLMNKKNLPKSALLDVNKIYTAAKNEKQEAQWVKAIIYKYYLQEGDDKNINQWVSEFEKELTFATPRVAAMLKSVEAEQLFQYLQGNRYQIRNRTAMTADTSTDIASWTIGRLNQRIRDLYLSYLDYPGILQQTTVDVFDPVLIKGNSRELRPTLYDILAWRALDYFCIPDMENTFAATDWVINNPALFSEAPYFTHYVFSKTDSGSNSLAAIKIYQQLLRFHAKDLHLDAWIDADISRIKYVNQIATMPERDSLYMNAMNRITRQYGTLSVASRAWFLQAQYWADLAASYDPPGDTAQRFDNLKARAICEQVIRHPDSSEGKSACERLLRNIRRIRYSLNVEQVNIPLLPFRVLVTYKNTGNLFGRIIRIDDATRELFERNNDDPKSWTHWLHMPYTKSFRQPLPETGDFQQHRVEIKMEGLEAGQYALLTSTDSVFNEKSILGLTTFFCSNIAYVANGHDYFVVDRDSGHPLQGVKVKAFVEKSTNSGYVYALARSYQTDINGSFRLQSEKNYYNLKLEFYNGKDYLSTAQYINSYRNDDDDNNDNKNKFSDYIFMDRSIYRPGQTVYFKGLLLTKDVRTKKYKLATHQQSMIYLMEVNDERIDSLVVKSNDFGSFNGSFKLPQNLLNDGGFRLSDAMTGDVQSFSVEEYKRPSFYVDYDSVKGSYRVGDTIRIKGSAMVYTGNAIDAAPVKWRVHREARFPYPWLLRYSPHRAEQEIAHGESQTDANGKFEIRFVALPDKTTNASARPVFSYRVDADVTDVKGESRSASSLFAASYQSFEIVSGLLLQDKISGDSLEEIPVTTKNAAGIFVKEKLALSVYALLAPDRLIRKRYWDQPDQFVLSEKEFVQTFPNDEYRNETEIETWKKGPRVFERTDSTSENGQFEMGSKKRLTLKPGWYLFGFSAIDKNGDEITDRRFVEITGNSGESDVAVYNLNPSESVTAEPGETIKIQTGSNAKDVFVIRVKMSVNDSMWKYSFLNLSQQAKNTSIEIRESDRGGFGIHDVFVKNNRWYSSIHHVEVPWTNKELKISYLTWKDKTLPGSKESWKINISGSKTDPVFAEVLTSMYDASLDQFKNHSWTMPDIYPEYQQNSTWDVNNNFDQISSLIRPDQYSRASPFYQNNYDALLILNPYFKMYKRMAFSANMNSGIERDDELAPGHMTGSLEFAKFTPPKIVKDEEDSAVYRLQNTNKNQSPGCAQIRKNFNETAFFQPDLKTDAQGNVEISFTMLDALTRWKWMILANTRDLSFGYAEKQIITQKQLMLQTNMPRFFREGDTMMLPVKIFNLSAQTMTGTIVLQWRDAVNGQSADQALGNTNRSQHFTVNASQSSVIFFPAVVPVHYTQPVLYRIIAKTSLKENEYSDGEENIIPVLSNRMLVTESLPLNMEGTENKDFVFDKLLKSDASSSLHNQSVTVEFSTNPAWYAVQSLPYLMEFPYECAEQTFNRFYANALATHIVEVSPVLQSVLEKWKNTDTAALLSNLQKNEELKSMLLRETPWVLQAVSETEQKKNLAFLFDMLKMRQALKSALNKLQEMQSENGGFAWFRGGRDDRYITQYIISGIGRLRKLKAIPADLQFSLDKIARSGIAYLDKEIKTDYERRDRTAKSPDLDPIRIQYLYMRSFFPDISVPGNIFSALNYYRQLSINKWTKQSVYMQGMIALFLNRTGDIKTSREILVSLKENATNSVEMGTYWKSVSNGFYWQEAPVETQSLLIELFQDFHADRKNIDQMKYWLLQQKRTTHWPTTKATADACYALLVSGSDWLSSQQSVSIQLGNLKVNSQEEKTEAGTGYLKKQIPADLVQPEMGHIKVSIIQPSTVNLQPSTVNLQPSSLPPSWGAIYWQYFENLDKITTAQSNLSITKNLFIERNSDKGPVLEAITSVNVLRPGDKLRMRIIVKSDRDLEYVHLKDMRAACLEPVNVLSGYQWQDGLGYYQTTKDASSSFFFDRLPKGTFVFEYPVFVTTAGNYSNGISSIECMYAPEFSAHSEGIRLHVDSK